MASFANVQVRSVNATLVPWSVVCLDPSQTLEEFFRSIKAVIVKTSPELSLAVLQSVCVGKDRSSHSLVQRELNVVDICTAFGLYSRFIVSLDEPKTSAEDISRNATRQRNELGGIIKLGHPNKMFSFCSVASQTVMRVGGLLLLLLQNV